MLNKDTWKLVSPYLDQALDLEPAERESWLAQLSAEHPEIARELGALLTSRDRLAEQVFLENALGAAEAAPSWAGKQVGSYTIQSLIGQGGMGDVWLALRSDGRFEGRFAIKFLRSRASARGALQRFVQEGRLLARLAHPNVARLIDAGVVGEDQPYLVLEYIDGVPIDGFCDAGELSIEARLKLFLGVLDAVAHAHSNLIVHRDLKPSNVLVTADGTAKLLDFGVAKLMEIEGQQGQSALTQDAGVALTPAFASPEQLTGGLMSTATDVYALGVLLYLLLTGRHPVGEGDRSPSELIRTIVDSEPMRPSSAVTVKTSLASQHAAQRRSTPEKLMRALRGDLDTIIAKALKKDPAQRYASVAVFADDISRYLRHEPISARPDTLAYRSAKFVRRHRVVVALASLAFLAMIGGAAGTLVQAHRARLERDFAMDQLRTTNQNDEFLEFLLSNAAPQGTPFTADQMLALGERIVNRQNSSNPLRRAKLLMWIGDDYMQRDRAADGRRVLEEVYRITRNLPDRELRGAASCQLADVVARGEEVDRGEALFLEGIAEIPDEARYAVSRASCFGVGAEVARARGDAETGVKRAEVELRLMMSSPQRSDSDELHALQDLAEALSEAGRDLEALPRFERAAALQSALGYDETQDAVVLYSNWALELDQVGRPLDAVRLYDRIMAIGNAGNPGAVAPMILTNYGKALRQLDRLPQASETLSRAYAGALELKDEVVINQSLLERSRIYILQHDARSAKEMLDLLEPRLQKSLPKGHYAFAALASARARIAVEQGDLAQAERLLNEARDILEAAVKAGRAGAYTLPPLLMDRAAVEIRLGHFGAALDDANQAVRHAASQVPAGTLSSAVGHTYLTLAKALAANGRAPEARAAAKQAAEHLQRTLGEEHPDTQQALKLAAADPPKADR
jgi:serine/threonine protein kinase/tetratricopeptide (TPR) repeat protein